MSTNIRASLFFTIGVDEGRGGVCVVVINRVLDKIPDVDVMEATDELDVAPEKVPDKDW